MTLKDYIRRRLDDGMSAEEAWRAAERERDWLVGWNYVRKIARDWQREKDAAAPKGKRR